jgi:hypothetical protein
MIKILEALAVGQQRRYLGQAAQALRQMGLSRLQQHNQCMTWCFT